ncbi:MAG TPA: hypothetical protein VK034_16480 [Enhygromyxa sp.]|nr:hypothetical protein [Enhygromyxa sp.]
MVVFGSAGAGKSTLGAVLAGDEVGPDYRDSRHLETYSLQGGVPCSILVPPGQESLRAATWSDLLREVSTGRSAIVIHVVSWGLNPIGDQKSNKTSGGVIARTSGLSMKPVAIRKQWPPFAIKSAIKISATTFVPRHCCTGTSSTATATSFA